MKFSVSTFQSHKPNLITPNRKSCVNIACWRTTAVSWLFLLSADVRFYPYSAYVN